MSKKNNFHLHQLFRYRNHSPVESIVSFLMCRPFECCCAVAIAYSAVDLTFVAVAVLAEGVDDYDVDEYAFDAAAHIVFPVYWKRIQWAQRIMPISFHRSIWKISQQHYAVKAHYVPSLVFHRDHNGYFRTTIYYTIPSIRHFQLALEPLN